MPLITSSKTKPQYDVLVAAGLSLGNPTHRGGATIGNMPQLKFNGPPPEVLKRLDLV